MRSGKVRRLHPIPLNKDGKLEDVVFLHQVFHHALMHFTLFICL